MTDSIQNILILDTTIFAIVLFGYLYKSPTINSWIGYKTNRSMKNQRNWDFAQKNFFKLWLWVIPIILFTQVPAFFGYDSSLILPLSFLQFLLVMMYAIVNTERKLKRMDNDQ